MQKILIGVLVLIVVAGGIWLFGNRDAQNPSGQNTLSGESADGAGAASDNLPAQGGSTDGTNVGVGVNVSVSEPVIVKITDAGFSPASVSVKKGQAVRWENNSSAGSWPASAVHPTHAVYPQKSSADCAGSSFDACRAVSAGESWTFTFTEVGSWKYHDHMKVSRTGTVVVTE